MSYLVSDFVINPVLRQARRFSRTNTASNESDLVTNQRTTVVRDNGAGEVAIDEVAEPASHGFASQYDGNENTVGVSGEPIVSSPIEERGGLDDALVAGVRHGEVEPSNTTLSRLDSRRSTVSMVIDNVPSRQMSGISELFRQDSPLGSSFNSVTHATPISPAEGPSRRSTLDGNRQWNTTLPENDGNNALRRKIISIQEMNVTAKEKARLMHQLLSEGYTSSQLSHAKSGPTAHSPVSMISQDRPITPSSSSSFHFWHSSDAATEPSPSASESTFQLSAEDLQPTFTPPKPQELMDQSGEMADTEMVQSLGCRHYKRNVKLQCSTCHRWYTCRLCHDEVEDHVLIRKETKNMLCMLCGYAQKAGEVCVECGVRTAWYYCGICKLWDDDTTKNIYHCNDCGICRVGRGLGKDFFHCKTCGLCMSISMEKGHKCIERSTDCDCPICGEYMFTSPQIVVFMTCGHTIHRDCYYAHLKSSYKCPICNQSVVNMETQFRNLDRAIESQPMPPQFQDTRAMVSCNDCRAKSSVKYHWLGLKCAVCDSYNTAQLQIIADPEITVPTTEVLETTDEAGPGGELEVDVDADEWGGIPHTPGPPRSRRHSSHIPQNRSPPNGTSQFFPYSVPQRIGRSVSPLRGMGRMDDPMDIDRTANYAASDDEDGADFWGGNISSRAADIDGEEEEEESESDEDSLSAMDEADDPDDTDAMELFGHR